MLTGSPYMLNVSSIILKVFLDTLRGSTNSERVSQYMITDSTYVLTGFQDMLTDLQIVEHYTNLSRHSNSLPNHTKKLVS
jgi:hypothetical protein